MERRGRKEAVIILILMIIIAIVIASWLTGLWSCDKGRSDLTEKEKLSIADYINSISVLIQHSNKVSVNFFSTLNKAKDTSKEELDADLSKDLEESKVIMENSLEINPPDFFDVSHGYLNLVFQIRNKSYEEFKPALSNIFQDNDVENSTAQIANSFLNMYLSDEIYKYFQEELKKSGEKLGVNNLTIIDSLILQDRNLINVGNVNNLLSEIRTVTSTSQRRGIAIISQGIAFNPQILNEQDQYLVIKKGSDISITIKIENQGNIAEKDVLVKMSYSVEGISKVEEKTYTIDTIEPSEQKSVTISGFKAYPGKKCEVKIDAGPVPEEVFLNNNTATFKFMMEN
ncbi:MAG: hypothetical protein M1308_00825 [Actinobacteria bacterium]|nr:hypothetical protein [Actinomycetota bacterium]